MCNFLKILKLSQCYLIQSVFIKFPRRMEYLQETQKSIPQLLISKNLQSHWSYF